MKKFYLLLLITFLFTSVSSFAGYEIFIRAIDNNGKMIVGTSTVVGHVSEIEIYSESFGMSNPCRTCSTSNPSLSSYNVMTKLSGAMIRLNQLGLEGTALQSVEVSYRRQGQTYDFYKVRMENVIVESLQESGSTGGDDTPIVSVSFNFLKIAYMFTAQSATGGPGPKTKGGWDVATKTPWSYF